MIDYLKSLAPFHGRHATDDGLRQCPFCGSRHVQEGTLDACAGPCRAVTCNDCGAHGPIRDTADAAIAYWNALHGLPKFSGLRAHQTPKTRVITRNGKRVFQQQWECHFDANPRQLFYEWRDVHEEEP